MRIEPSARPSFAPAAATQLAPRAQRQPEMQRAPAAQPSLLVMQANAKAPQLAARPDYAEMVAKLEPMIQQQLAQVQQTTAAQGLRPDDVQLVYAIDITGKETSVCLACGKEGHDYQPTKVRRDAPAIDMLLESLVVFQEVAARLGSHYGLMAYDDGGVFIVRPVGSPGDASTRAQAADRFQEFRDRFAKVTLRNGALRNGLVIDQAWLAREREHWVPADAGRRVAGEPQDALAIATVGKINSPHIARCITVVAKSQVPTASLRGAEAAAAKLGIALTGIAVGADARTVARNFLRHTVIAPTMHDLRTKVGEGLNNGIAQMIAKE